MLTGEQVRLSIQLLDGACLMSSSEAKRMAQILGSREELVAWLFLKRGYAARNEALRRVLEVMARSVATPVRASHADRGIALQPERARREAESAVKAILQSDSSQSQMADDALLRLVRIRPSTFQFHSKRLHGTHEHGSQ